MSTLHGELVFQVPAVTIQEENGISLPDREEQERRGRQT
jgi:hypothetical protein